MKTYYMDKKTTLAIKGIALVMMFIHHFFTFPTWYVDGISYPGLANFARIMQTPLMMCVPIFAFLTGYAYFFNPNKNYKYSLRKITDLLISYWMAYIPLLVIAVLLGCYQFNLIGVAKEMFALNTPIMCFCWYVLFYVAVMLMFPVLARMASGSLARDFIAIVILPAIAFAILNRYIKVVDLIKWMPCVSMGYLVAKHSLFENVFDKITARLPKFAGYPIWILAMAAAIFGRRFFPGTSLCLMDLWNKNLTIYINVDIVYAPLFIYGAANLIRSTKQFIWKIFIIIGESSMLMWFLHSGFFNVTRETMQPILYWPRNPVLVVIFGLGICYLLARVINIPLKPLLKLKNKLLLGGKNKRESA